MTFTEIVTEITSRLNVTSSDSSARIGRRVNQYYKRITTALNLKTSRRGTGTGSTVIGSRFVTFTSMETIDRAIDDSAGQYKVLDEKTYDYLRDRKPTTSAPAQWAVKTRDATSVVIILDCIAQDVRALTADGDATVATLSGTNVPVFPESFHDVLVEAVLKDEYKKQEKPELAQLSLSEYREILSDLKMYVAKRAYLKIRQGETPRGARVTQNRIS